MVHLSFTAGDDGVACAGKVNLLGRPIHDTLVRFSGLLESPNGEQYSQHLVSLLTFGMDLVLSKSIHFQGHFSPVSAADVEIPDGKRIVSSH